MAVEQKTKPAQLGQRWTADEIHYISDHYGLLLDETIARNLDRSVRAVVRTAEQGLHIRRRDNFYSASELSRTLGLSDGQGRKVVGWVERGWLKARKGPTAGGRKRKGGSLSRMWTFREASILRCLRRRPWLVDLASMPEHFFRSVVRREWERDPWYSISQLHSLGTKKTILHYIHRGWLAAEKKPCGGPNGGAWVIRDSAIEALLANDPRPRSKFKALSESRRNFLLESGQASKLAVVWLLKCPSCGQEVRVDAPPQLYGPQVRERFITLYVNGNCEHGSYCQISLNGDQQKLEHLAQRRHQIGPLIYICIPQKRVTRTP